MPYRYFYVLPSLAAVPFCALLLGALVFAALPAAAQVTAVPASIVEALEVGESTTLPLTLENAGASAVEARLVRRKAGSAGTGDLFAASRVHGVVRLDPTTGAVIGSAVPIPRSTVDADGLAFDGEGLYVTNGSGSNALYRYDPETGEQLGAMRLPYGVTLDGLAHTGHALYATDPVLHVIYEIDFEAGTIVRTIDPGVGIIGGITGGGSRGTLFVSGNQQADHPVYEVDPESGEVLRSIVVPGFLIGLAYSEELGLLFAFEQVGPSSGRLFAVDPDTGEEVYEVPTADFEVMGSLAADEFVGVAEWLVTAPTTVTVPASGSAQVEVTLDASSLTEGDYAADLVVLVGGDPAATVPVTLSVTGTPAIAADPDALAFGDVVVGATAERVLTVRNTGTAPLTVSGVSTTSADVDVSADGFTLAPGRTARLTVALTPSSTGAVSASVLLQSNDPDQPTLAVDVSGAALPAPAVALAPDTLTAVADAGEATTATLSVANAGAGPLTFEVFAGADSLLAPGRATPAGYLPTVIDDPAGDTVGEADVVAFRARTSDGSLHVEIEFAEEVGLEDNYPIAFFLDVDQDAETGFSPRFDLPPVIGAEFEVGLQLHFSHVIVFGAGEYGIEFDGPRVRFSVPLAALGDEDGSMDVVGIAGEFGAYDSYPNTGYGTIGSPTWLSLAPAAGTVLPGGDEDVAVTLDASALLDGTYSASILVHTNDPETQDVLVPVGFEVEGTPGVVVEPGALAFGGVFVGGSATDTLYVANPGTATLVVSALGSGDPAVTAGLTSFSVAPGDTVGVAVTFAPSEVGPFASTLTITSDDPGQPEVVVEVSGEGLEAPLVSVTPEALEVTLAPGGEAVETLTITNGGGSPLTFEVNARAGDGDALPLILEDPADVDEDGEVPPLDVLALRGRAFGGELQLEVEHVEGFDPDWLKGFIWLDADENAATGQEPGWAHPDQEIGMEYEISLGDVFVGLVYVYDGEFNEVGSYPVEVNDTSFRFAIPLADLGGDDGQMHVAGLTATGGFTGLIPVDYFPDAGYGEVGGVDWVTLDAASGTAAPGGTAEVAVTFGAAELAEGTYTATLVVSTNDPSQPSLEVPVMLTVAPDVASEPGAVPAAYALQAGYPNPFRSTTSLGVDLPEATFVEVVVYDVQGRAVRSLLEEERPAGRHEVTFEGDGLASGVYFCRMRAGTFAATTKLLLVR